MQDIRWEAFPDSECGPDDVVIKVKAAAAGELGSVFGHLYMSGGNLAECFIGGEIAGRNAVNAHGAPGREAAAPRIR